MISTTKIKKLAQIASVEKTMPKDIEEYVLKVMTKHELKEFLRFYKGALQKRRVFVESSSELSHESLQSIHSLFKNKDIITSVDANLGAGIKIINDDIIIDFTFKKYINDTIEKLKN